MPLNGVTETFGSPKQRGPLVSSATLKKMVVSYEEGLVTLIYAYDDPSEPDAHFQFRTADVSGLDGQINGMTNGIHNHIKAQL